MDHAKPAQMAPKNTSGIWWVWPLVLPDWLLITALIFGGCCSNVFALESIVQSVPHAGHFITFGQFAFVALEGLIRHLEWTPRPASRDAMVQGDNQNDSPPLELSRSWWLRLKPRVVPWYRWMSMVVLYFTVSILNNWALAFISVPLHIVFRSGSLMMNMIVGYLAMGKRYSVAQVMAVACVTLGVTMATLGSQRDTTTNPSTARSREQNDKDTSAWLLGIGILVLAMVLIAVLGLMQERTYRQYSNAWREGMFYNHALALPLFAFFWPSILDQMRQIHQGPQAAVGPAIAVWLPSRWQTSTVGQALVAPQHTISIVWGYVALNIFTQYICAMGVNQLTARAPSLTVNLVLNLRKLISLVLSVVLFNNPFSHQAKLGCVLVFLGTFIYSQAGRRPSHSIKKTQ
ncbi:golgi uridine diphosphate-N- acetylglucosamine transporter [Dimargaris verticillata]|uniref:Golgi uridine diphosphate-N- acetylglucosamine transporter n=1 Tax=Dimargaris verticillata TaxID=2761393 RepID=A0A9W8B570_9FUNG|nr:golgi uridine diphosphate-N- acetylglucosamine transporter [Dimargaris verticillata]